MIPHHEIIDALLGIEPKTDIEARLLLTKALTALRMSKPVNDRSRQQIEATRRQITQVLRKAA